MRSFSYKLVTAVAVVGLLPLSVAASAQAPPAARSDMTDKARLIVLTDIGNEPDDSESMVRLLLYSNDIDIEGLVAATSRHHPKDPRLELIRRRVDAYGAVLANLRKHDRRYPDAEVLRGRMLSGSPVYGMSGVGAGKDTAASRLIIAAVDRPDPRPVWVAGWGGVADLAQALWTVRETRPPEEVKRFVGKLRVYTISDQDDAGPWARAFFPELFWVTNVHAFTNYQFGTWLGISAPAQGADQEPVSPEWLAANIRAKGPLGALYPLPAYIMEGDTPSFLSLIPNGLNVPQRPDWGGWGGRYGKVSNALGLWSTTADEVQGSDGKPYTTPQATIWRWRPAFQNDFAARMQWSVTPDFKQANHAPAPRLNGRSGPEPVAIEACPGKPITLSADGSSDTDGDRLSYRWWWYREATGLFAPQVTLSADSGGTTTVRVGDTARVDQFTPPSSYTLHVILEATDDGAPQLTSYRRALITVPGADSGTPAPACAVRPIAPTHEDE
ncbi:MAG: nucleoside hydrolase-like domain-containing protein [Novosphingobium sp.]